MNILVIGNGFDVAHGLPTSYSDFLYFTEFFTEYNNTQDITEKETRKKQFEKISKKRYINYFSNLDDWAKKEYCSLIENNAWFNHFYDVFEKRVAEGKKGWIDFEAEISDSIQELDRIRKEVRSRENDEGKDRDVKTSDKKIPYKTVKRIFPNSTGISFSIKKINEISKRLINDLNRLTRCLELYLKHFITDIEINSCNKIPLFEKEISPDYIITFNYTETYEIKYLKEHNTSNCANNIHYIHGRARRWFEPSSTNTKKIGYEYDKEKSMLSYKQITIEDCDLVLGIEEYLEGDDRQKDNEYIEFKKFYQRIYKGTGSKYTKWLKYAQCTDEKVNVTIYGHSIATTDGDIIKNLIEAAATTTIYYYGKSALHDIILNLVQIIGEEKLIEMTSDDSKSGRIIFKPVP